MRLARTVITAPDHSGTGATDQSETPRVTTAPRCGTPSLNSTPALIQRSASARTSSPAWSNCAEKSATKVTSAAVRSV